MKTEQELLEELRNNSQAAFSEIYAMHWSFLLATATRVLREAEDAADVVQEVFLALWNRRAELPNMASLAGYLHTSVKYKAIHFIEKNITRHDYLAVLKEMSVHTNTQDPNALVQLKELRDVVYNVVAGMPPKMQQAYRLSREQYLTHKQIAETMNISPETVKKHIQHALDMIKIAIQDHSLVMAGVSIISLL